MVASGLATGDACGGAIACGARRRRIATALQACKQREGRLAEVIIAIVRDLGLSCPGRLSESMRETSPFLRFGLVIVGT